MKIFLTLLLVLATQAQATPTQEVVGRSVAILTSRLNQIGSGVILDRGILLTNFHVLIERVNEPLTIKTEDGRHFSIFPHQHLVPHQALAYDGSNDYAFALFEDPQALGPQTPVRITELSPSSELTLPGWFGNLFSSSETNLFEKRGPMILHCNHTQNGYSGSPVFDQHGALVALNRGGIEEDHPFCPDQTLTAYSLQAKYIFATVSRLIPEIMPFLERSFFPKPKSSHSCKLDHC